MKKNFFKKIILIILMLISLFFVIFFSFRLYIELYFTNSNLVVEKDKEVKFNNDEEGISNTSIFDLYLIRRQAQKENMQGKYIANIEIPSVNIKQYIYRGANKKTLSLGAATDVYEYAEPGIGNFVICGHNFGMKNVLFSNLPNIKKGDKINIEYRNKKYVYEVKSSYWGKDTVTYVDGKVEDKSAFSLPKEGEPPKLTMYTCESHGITEKRFIVECTLLSIN